VSLTLLKMTQLILSSMDSDEVNSIGDTAESLQVVDAIESVFYDLIGTIDFPEHWDFFELLPSNDITRPTLMTLPDNVGKLEWVQYSYEEDGDTTRNFREVFPLERFEFLNRMNALSTDDDDVYSYDLEVGDGTFNIRGKNDAFPVYYTTNNDRTLIFDNFRLDLNQTLVGNKTWCYGQISPVFEREDEFIPNLTNRQFTLLFNEAKAQCFLDLKTIQNAKAEQKARRGWVQAHRKSPQTGKVGRQHWDFTYDFGRKGRRNGH
jgi:hypothetical protein